MGTKKKKADIVTVLYTRQKDKHAPGFSQKVDTSSVLPTSQKG